MTFHNLHTLSYTLALLEKALCIPFDPDSHDALARTCLDAFPAVPALLIIDDRESAVHPNRLKRAFLHALGAADAACLAAADDRFALFRIHTADMRFGLIRDFDDQIPRAGFYTLFAVYTLFPVDYGNTVLDMDRIKNTDLRAVAKTCTAIAA